MLFLFLLVVVVVDNVCFWVWLGRLLMDFEVVVLSWGLLCLFKFVLFVLVRGFVCRLGRFCVV